MNSMTGYGRATCQVLGRRLVIEIRSLNHRFFDVKLKLPWNDAQLEMLITQAVRKRAERGALALTVREDPGGPPPEVRVDVGLARRYHEALAELARELALPDARIPIEVLVTLRDVVTVGGFEKSSEEVFSALEPGLLAALGSWNQMRAQEGAVLAGDLRANSGLLRGMVGQMGRIAQAAPELYRKRLEERIARLIAPGQLDPQRLAQEVALLADRGDVSEELVRLESHLSQFDALLGGAGPVGRKLDFLLQELNREVNTVGSKAQSSDMAGLVVEAKGTLERMREQVQNVE